MFIYCIYLFINKFVILYETIFYLIILNDKVTDLLILANCFQLDVVNFYLNFIAAFGFDFFKMMCHI